MCLLFISWNHFAFLPTDPPYISKAKNTGVSVGQKGILSCEASAVPTAEFQWFKEDTRYLGNGNRACGTQSRRIIPTRQEDAKVKEKDAMKPTCIMAFFIRVSF